MQPLARQAEVGTAESGIEQGGSGCPDIGEGILGSDTICTDIQVRDMGSDLAYAEVAGWIPPQGGPHTDGAATVEGMGQRLGFTPYVGCNGEGGVIESGDLRLLPPEHRGTMYFDQDHYGPVSGGEAEVRAKSDNAVMVTVGSGLGGNANGGPGGGVNGGGGGDGRYGDWNGRLVK